MIKNFVFVFLILLSFKITAQQSDSINRKIEDINNYIVKISSLCENNDTVCSKKIRNGPAYETNGFTGFPIKNRKHGNGASTSTFYNKDIFSFNDSYYFDENGERSVVQLTYYFNNRELIKYIYIDTTTSANENIGKINHKIIIYFNNKDIIKKELTNSDKLSKKEIKRIIEFAESYKYVIIR